MHTAHPKKTGCCAQVLLSCQQSLSSPTGYSARSRRVSRAIATAGRVAGTLSHRCCLFCHPSYDQRRNAPTTPASTVDQLCGSFRACHSYTCIGISVTNAIPAAIAFRIKAVITPGWHSPLARFLRDSCARATDQPARESPIIQSMPCLAMRESGKY